MIFGELLQGLRYRLVQQDLAVPVRSVVTDSRKVGPGDVFVALPGQEHDGHSYIPDALARGAAAVVCEHPPADTGTAVVVQVEDAARVVGPMASAQYGHPSRRLQVIGVTGTDGKTTTTLLIAAILRAAGRAVGHCTTIEVHNGQRARRNTEGFTTPQAPELQRMLAEMVATGCQAAVVEVSSHALATGRVEGCEFDGAVFTNLAPEHLDYHVSLEAYRAAKGRLFEQLSKRSPRPWPPVGAVNLDDPEAGYFLQCYPPARTYGFASGAQVTAEDVRCTPQGSAFSLVAPEGRALVHTRLLGQFNVRNWLAAAAVTLPLGVGPAQVTAAAAALAEVPGRMERIDAGQAFTVYVDFAHTPQGLAAALDTAQELHPDGRVIAVFGHAGRRDPNHRRDLVVAASPRCHHLLLTMDDPYDEDPAAILDTMRAAALAQGLREGDHFQCVLDRREAFAAAFARARPGDVVLLAGRGHEQTIPLDQRRVPFHDPTVARELLAQAG